jgi:hypothetical protein
VHHRAFGIPRSQATTAQHDPPQASPPLPQVRRVSLLAEVRRPRLTEFWRKALPLNPGSSTTGRGGELTGERRASEGGSGCA